MPVDIAVPEGNATNTVRVPVHLSAPRATDTVVDLAIDGDGTDVDSSVPPAVIRAGDTVGYTTLTVRGDSVVEPDETFTVTITGAYGATIAADATAIIVFRNDDPKPPTCVTIGTGVLSVKVCL